MKNKLALLFTPVLCILLEIFFAAVLQQAAGTAVRTTIVVNAIMIAFFVALNKFVLRFDKPDARVPKHIFRFSVIQIPLWLCGQIAATYIITTYPDSYEATKAVFDDSVASEYLLLCIILAPIAEELLFRGIWYRCYERLFGVIPAVILSAGMFALMHGNVPQGYIAVLMGLLYGLVMRMTGDVRIAILLHMIANIMDSLAPVLRIPVFMFQPYFWVPVSVIIIAGLLVVLFIYRKRPVIETVEEVQADVMHDVIAADDGWKEDDSHEDVQT